MKRANWFMFLIGIQYLLAFGMEAFGRKRWLMAIVYACYGISAFALGLLQ